MTDDPHDPRNHTQDLTKEPVGPAVARLQHYNQDRAHDRVRASVTGAAVLILIVLSGASFASAMYGGRSVDDVTKIHALVVGPWFGLVGSVVGYYFAGGRSKS